MRGEREIHVEPTNLSDRGGPEELAGRPDPDIEDLEAEEDAA